MSYLVNETTKEERIKLVNKALAISLSGAKRPSDEVIKLVKKYIDGNMELDEITKLIISKYHKGVESND